MPRGFAYCRCGCGIGCHPPLNYEEVEEDKQKAANDRARDYRNFIKGAVNEKGSQVLHRLAREPKPQAPIEITTNKETKTTADQAHADNQRGIWKEVWNGSDTQTTRTPIELPCKPIVSPNKMDRERLRKTIRSFKHTTAITYDNLKPHILDELTDEAINEIIVLFRHIENKGRWPKQWEHPVMVMIPKSKHGEWRLIAMLPALYRVWAKQAGKDVSAWMHSLNRDWIAFGPGKAAEAAAYDVALEAECTTGPLEDWAATTMSDLHKGFEKVVHSHLITAAYVYNLPMYILRMALDMYTSPRRIRCGAAVCKPVWTSMGLLAGCPIAMGALCLAVLKPIDDLTREIPRSIATIKVYVDDFRITHIANAQLSTMYEAAYQLQDITRRMHQKLAQVDLHCSTDKNQVLVNRKDYAQVVEHALSEWKYTITDTTKLLGVDFAAGKRCNFENALKRKEKAKAAANRMEVYNIQGVNITNAVRAHTAGCTQYGIMATGMPDNILGEVTTTLRATTYIVADGGSASADLLLQKSRHLHPAYAAHTVPITRWAQHIYMLNIDDNVSNNKIDNKMKKAFEASTITIPHEKHPWALKGPASAVIATLLRIKWKVTTFDKWITDPGTVVELRTITPVHLALCFGPVCVLADSYVITAVS